MVMLHRRLFNQFKLNQKIIKIRLDLLNYYLLNQILYL